MNMKYRLILLALLLLTLWPVGVIYGLWLLLRWADKTQLPEWNGKLW